MLAKSISGAAAAASPAYIEDVFSTYLYTGTGATQTITNGIDLSGNGGLVWIKGRSGATGHRFTDTARGATKSIESNSTAAEVTESTGLTAFGNTGFTIGSDGDYNNSLSTYVSWAFRKQAKFFDVVTYTGDGVAGRTVPHSLGSVPGCIIIKRTNAASSLIFYHRSLGNTEYLIMNSTAAKATDSTGILFNSTTPTSTVFSLGTGSNVNATGSTYVAYLFAHDAGGFGLTGTDNVISCGSYTSTGGTQTINLGYEPQWLLIKNASSASGTIDWLMVDNMRGLTVANSNEAALFANLSNSETSSEFISITSTGFNTGTAGLSVTGATYIYIAIRRGPMKVPTSGTSVFTPVTRTGTGAATTTTAGFPVDMGMTAIRTGTNDRFSVVDRMRANNYLRTASGTSPFAEANTTAAYPNNPFDNQTALKLGSTSLLTNASASTYVDHLFRRAPGFFDVVAYTGTGANRTINHNLGAVPELMIIKQRGDITDWAIYDAHTGNTKYQTFTASLPTTESTVWNNTSPSSTTFTVGSSSLVNQSAGTYIAYLFGTVSGVSKVGSYTGTGTTKQIDCGFTGGARYVLIKRTDDSRGWYVWDTARGIIAGNDPYLQLSSRSGETTSTDYIDTYSAGFEISSTAPADINANGGTFIFLAIA